MKKIRKILLPIASAIGMTTCIAPMAACNTTSTTVATTTAAKTNDVYYAQIIIESRNADVGAYTSIVKIGLSWKEIEKPTIKAYEGFKFTGKWINRDTKKYMTDDFVFSHTGRYHIDPEIVYTAAKFTAMPETTRCFRSGAYYLKKWQPITYNRTKPFKDAKWYENGWDEPVFDDKNQLWFRNSKKDIDTRFITETVRVDITVPAHKTRKTLVNIDEYITSATNGHVCRNVPFDCISEIFRLENENDHPNLFIDSLSSRKYHKIGEDIASQSRFEQNRRIGDCHWQHAEKRGWCEWHTNREWKDTKTIFVDENTTNEPKVFSHYIQVSANTLQTEQWDDGVNRECGYRFAFSADEFVE